MNENPFASPQTDAVDQPPTSEAEETRQRYLSHEASIQSIGYLYYLGALFFIFAGGGLLISLMGEGEAGAGELGAMIGITGLMVALAALQIWVGRGLRSLKRRVKISVGILSGIGLFGFPFGTIINGYILYLVFSRKGAMVFSEEYAEVIAQTPHIKYKTSKIVTVLFVILLVLIVFGLVGALFVD